MKIYFIDGYIYIYNYYKYSVPIYLIYTMISICEPYQTRNYKGSLKYYSTFSETYNAFLEDPTIWKISFDKDGKCYRWISKQKTHLWKSHCENRLNELSSAYASDNTNGLFWVNEPMDYPEFGEIYNNMIMSQEQKNVLLDTMRIIQVVTNDEFLRMFS